MPTVLIAAPPHLAALKQRDRFREALAFVDTDALRAFAAIARQQADVVVIESAFAGTARGAALINRIKSDPLLAGCDVQVLSSGDPQIPDTSVRRDEEPRGPETRSAGADHTVAADASPIGIRNGVEVVVDGNTAVLVKLSTSGAEVLSTSSLKPQQRVRLTLPGRPAIQVSGEITWAMFEMPSEGPRYRADVLFLNPDAARITAFIEANRSA